jgi:hypothetical protein
VRQDLPVKSRPTAKTQVRTGPVAAQGRYKLGLSSIVELSQAQLNLTQAQIADTSAKYDFQIQSAVLSYQMGQLRQENLCSFKP